MATYSTNTTVANTSSTTFQAWVNEIYDALVTECGLSQTADTGQMANPCTTSIPGAANTSAGYYVFEFNDTLNSSYPVVIKLEFGTAAATTDLQMWITVGTGSNGSGTINGTVMTRVAVCGGAAPSSTSTNYVSRYCYNSTQGFLGMAFKIGSTGTSTNATMGGFLLFRSVNSSGDTTGDSVMLLTPSSTATGSTTDGNMQVLSYNLSAAYLNSNPIASTLYWGFIPFSSTGTLEGSAGQIFPVFQWNGSSTVPGYGITSAAALALISEISIGSTVTVTVLGSVSLTYISVGSPVGTSSLTGIGYSATSYTMLMLWE